MTDRERLQVNASEVLTDLKYLQSTGTAEYQYPGPEGPRFWFTVAAAFGFAYLAYVLSPLVEYLPR